jgi:hypothetical protein
VAEFSRAASNCSFAAALSSDRNWVTLRRSVVNVDAGSLYVDLICASPPIKGVQTCESALTHMATKERIGRFDICLER